MNIEDECVTTDDIKSKLQIATEAHKQVMKEAKELRSEHLIKLAEKDALDNDTTVAKAIQELMVHEELREIYKAIKSKMKDFQKTQLDSIWIKRDHTKENTEENKLVVDLATDINKKLLQRNRRHLN